MKKIKDWWNKNYRYSASAQRRHLTTEDYKGVQNKLGGWKKTLDQRRTVARAHARIKFKQAFLLGVALGLTNKIIEWLF